MVRYVNENLIIHSCCLKSELGRNDMSPRFQLHFFLKKVFNVRET
jgi:hypothetical protein